MDTTFTKLIDKLKTRHIYLDKETLSRYTTGPVRPYAVIEPESPQVMSELIRECFSNKTVTNIWGSGSHQNFGGLIQPYDITLSTRYLNGIIDYEPDNLTVTVQSGISLENIQSRVITDNLFLPINPPNSATATIGGLLAANMFGSFIHSYGTFRDFVLGGSAILADGQQIKFGGKTVKNVAGYDMAKLFTGSMGTIGLLTELTFKLSPVPEKILSLHVRAENHANLEPVVDKIKHTSLPVLSSVLSLEFKEGAALHPALSIVFQVRANEVKNVELEINKSFAQDVSVIEYDFEFYSKKSKEYDAFFDVEESGVLCEWIAPKSQIFGIMSFLQKESEVKNRHIKILSYPAQGIIYCKFTADEKSDLPATAAQLAAWRQNTKFTGGFLNIKRCPDRLKEHFDVWDMDKDQLKWHKKIKNEFDPIGVFTGGRFVGGL